MVPFTFGKVIATNNQQNRSCLPNNNTETLNAEILANYMTKHRANPQNN